MEQKYSSNKKVGISIAILSVIVVVLATLLNESTNTSKKSVTTNSTVNTNTNLPAQQPISSASAVTTKPTATVPKQYSVIYKNGSYSAVGSYSSPGGEDQISVSITLANDIITDAVVTSVKADRTSQKYQNKFIAGFKQYVVGKNISSVKLDVVSGSSLTPDGFNDALTQIKAQAKA